jgi:hypothetical protein
MPDVTFGDTTVHGAPVSFSSGDQVATKYTLSGGSPTAVLKDIALCCEASGAHTMDYILAVWRDVAGSPGAEVGFGAITPPAGAFASQFLSVLGTGNSITLVDAGGVMADGDYWIGPWRSPGSAYNFDFLVGSNFFASPGGAGPSNPFGSPTATTFAPVANATVTFAAAPSADLAIKHGLARSRRTSW